MENKQQHNFHKIGDLSVSLKCLYASHLMRRKTDETAQNRDFESTLRRIEGKKDGMRQKIFLCVSPLKPGFIGVCEFVRRMRRYFLKNTI